MSRKRKIPTREELGLVKKAKTKEEVDAFLEENKRLIAEKQMAEQKIKWKASVDQQRTRTIRPDQETGYTQPTPEERDYWYNLDRF